MGRGDVRQAPGRLENAPEQICPRLRELVQLLDVVELAGRAGVVNLHLDVTTPARYHR